MMPNPVHRLPAPIEAAVQSLRLALRAAVERTIESLGLAALASGSTQQRDGLLAAQFELNRKSAVFILAFNAAFEERILREVGAQASQPSASAPTRWDALSLVENREVELQILADRFGMDIALACEWELRELGTYVGALLNRTAGEKESNPLRPEIIGHALVRGVEAVSDKPAIRIQLSSEIARSLSSMLRSTYAEIVADMRRAGVEPLGMSLRSHPTRAANSGNSALDTMPGSAGRDMARGHTVNTGHSDGHAMDDTGPPTGGRAAHVNPPAAPGGWQQARQGTPMGHVDAALMSLIRRLAFSDPGETDAASARFAGQTHRDGAPTGPGQVLLPNLIRAHRDELRQASSGTLDHLVIDVIGGMFDQIMSDPKVQPQMARQIARLQLPVLRAALGDASFFASRRHPVRRFVNRIASLGAAIDDFSDDAGQRFLAKVRELIQAVVEGEFDQIEIYEQELAALEAFVVDQAERELKSQGDAAELLSQKEDEQRLHQLYAQRLQGDLKALAGPEFVRDFISGVWSQALLRVVETDGPDSALAQRLRRVGRELFMSVQPKATAAHRKAFLAELPKLMLELTEGMNLIGWPESQRRQFFGQLMPAHAEALRSQSMRQLDVNLLARQVEGALEKPLPSRAELSAAPANLPVLTEVILPAKFSADEAQRIGWVDEAAIDWIQAVDVDLGEFEAAANEAAQAVRALPGLPSPSEPAEPVQGIHLADHVQIGYAYKMHLQEGWQKVRLTHVSAARSFFVFTHGQRHKQVISLTRRMLQRLCESGRLRAFEASYLIERATARARRQLAGVAAEPKSKPH